MRPLIPQHKLGGEFSAAVFVLVRGPLCASRVPG